MDIINKTLKINNPKNDNPWNINTNSVKIMNWNNNIENISTKNNIISSSLLSSDKVKNIDNPWESLRTENNNKWIDETRSENGLIKYNNDKTNDCS